MSDTLHQPSTRTQVLLAAAVLLAALVATFGLPSTSGTLTGQVNNNTNSAASAVFASEGTGSCTDLARTANAHFAYPFADPAGPVVADASGNARPGTYTLTGVTYNVNGPCPRDGRSAITLDGSTGYVSGPLLPTTTPTNYSTQIWFRATAAGGKLIGFGNNRVGASTQYDRHVYMHNDGRLTFGVRANGNPRTITTPGAYNDNRWHHLVVTSANNNSPATGGIRIYVDGALQASDRASATGANYTGYWRIGYDNLNGWPNAPTNPYFTGSLAYAAYFTSTLTAEQVAALYLAGT